MNDGEFLTEEEIAVLREDLISDGGWLPGGRSRVSILCDMALQVATLTKQVESYEEMFHNAKSERDALRNALWRVVGASDRFLKDTGMKHGDLLTDAVEYARKWL
jgi:hypothetical protein